MIFQNICKYNKETGLYEKYGAFINDDGTECREGEYICYSHDDDTIINKCNYINNKIDGLFIIFYYTNSKINGAMIMYYKYNIFFKMKKTLFLFVLSVLFLSCSRDKFNNNNPYLPNYSFSIDTASSFALPWLSWTSQFILIVFTGIISLIILPFYNRKPHVVSK